MTTEGIKKDIVITDKESAEKFVEALERISTKLYGKQTLFYQGNNVWYSRNECKNISTEKAIDLICEEF